MVLNAGQEAIHRHAKGRNDLRNILEEFIPHRDGTIDMMIETGSEALRGGMALILHVDSETTLFIHRKIIPKANSALEVKGEKVKWQKH